ncbi:family 16 glycoside hydrolase [Neorhodopirellula pilleata]|uniref:Trehalose utilization n=1 Tax=Neorhodopirellula pilleata TaxID=2714738 RepID=A0A5C6A9Z0_9BACT|nr:family 16 glycoside hydrolase [Neorhodopirellula pilleata]TWT96220.1 Trehalose utilization [Neorhodopirellula pilleata]
MQRNDRSRFHVPGYWSSSLAILLIGAGLVSPAFAETAKPIKALLIDGQNNHNWQQTSPLIKETLESGGLCEVTIATAPGKDEDQSSFSPNFQDYDVVVSNYNGQSWSDTTEKTFVEYIAGGGGLVVVHAADNSFSDWDAYNRMIGLGGWGGRNEKNGPYVRWKEDLKRFTRDDSPGRGGQHGKRVPFQIVVRERNHPITEGLPPSFMQVADELYGELRGPAENLHVLATAYSDPATGGTGEHEPILMTVHFGNGRVFHTTLGHDTTAMNGLAFQTSLRRGTQWAATTGVTLPPVDGKVLTSNEAASGAPTAAAEAEGNATEITAAMNEPPNLDASGWVTLFDGESLQGWTQKNGTASYRVEEGAIVGKTAVGSPNSFLCSDKDYGDFELAFEVNVDEGLNSGVQIRSKTREDGGRVYGPQVEIESTPGEAGYIYGEATGRGWITKEQPIKDAYQNGKFNQFRVRAIGDRIQTWINDTQVADIVDPESAREGFIGLQVHGIPKDQGPYQVRWKNIRVRPVK